MTLISQRFSQLKHWWRVIIIIFTPLVFLPLPIVIGTIQARCAYIVLILIVYWVSEAMPYAVASLFPLAFFPLAGIIPGDRVGYNYFKDISTLFLGSMTLAQAMEHVHLHRRLALLVLSLVGSSIKWSMAGLMIVTAFLSMWINNSAATSIMIPAAVAIIDELRTHREQIQTQQSMNETNQNRRASKEILPNQSTVVFDIEQQKVEIPVDEGTDMTDFDSLPIKNDLIDVDKTKAEKMNVDYDRLKTGFLIAVAYSAAIGGLATLVGTGPNIFVKGFTDDFYADGPHAFEISFTNFLLFALPTGLMMHVICWLWLQLLYNRRDFLPWIKKDQSEIQSQKHLKTVLQQQYKDLGPLSWQEGVIAILFVFMVGLWITRDFSSYPGWEILFRKDFVTDGTVALLIGSLPLIFPNQNPFNNKQWEYHPILPWDQLSKKFPWGVFMLQGAGLAIADAFKASDLSWTIANFLSFVVGASDVTIIFVIILISAIFTEFSSNLACASILFPILDSIAKTAGIHAARLILPSCMAVSLSFMLPIATPPNAMIFASGNVKIPDLIKAGIGMKLFGCLVILFTSTTFLSPIFHTYHPQDILTTNISLNSTM